MHFGRPLAHFWLPFGSRWLTFGSRWLTFGSRWLTFGSLWLPFGSLWRPFGSLRLPFGSRVASFESLLLSPGLIFHSFMHFRRKYRAKSYFYEFSIENQILSQPNRIFPKRAERTPTENTSSFVTYLQGPGAEHLP